MSITTDVFNLTMVRALGTCVITGSGQCGPTNTSIPIDRCLFGTVSCPSGSGIDDITVNLKVSDPTGSSVATAVFYAGGSNVGMYQAVFANSSTHVLTPCLQDGIRVIQVGWNDPAPFNTMGVFSGQAGTLSLMCRTATLSRAIHDDPTLHTPGTPFIVCGNSGGSSQISYTLAHYGGGDWIDLAILTGGPPHARLDFGSMGVLNPIWRNRVASQKTVAFGLEQFQPNITSAWFVCHSYGPNHSAIASRSIEGGPENRGFKDSVCNGTAEYRYPRTNVHFIYGTLDASEAVPLGREYANRVLGKTTTIHIVTGTGHSVPHDEPGGTLIYSIIRHSRSFNH